MLSVSKVFMTMYHLMMLVCHLFLRILSGKMTGKKSRMILYPIRVELNENYSIYSRVLRG